MEGWVSLYRKFINWQWYKDPNVKSVFIHLLLCANHKEETVGKRIINRGQLITSRESLSKSLGLSEQQIRTCLKKLEKTNELSIQRTNKYSVITVLKYDYYQKSIDEISTNKITNKSTSKKDDESTNKNDMQSTSKNILESVDNSRLLGNEKEKATNQNSSTSTNKKRGKSTNTSTNISTTNNNINNKYNNNLTKLNYIFNLIINNNNEELKIDKLSWQGFKIWLKKLDLDVTQNYIDFLSVETQLEYKIILLTLLKVYQGPYKHYKEKIKREDIFHKMDKAREYRGNIKTMTDEELKEFINYYWKCLQNKLDGSDNNAKS